MNSFLVARVNLSYKRGLLPERRSRCSGEASADVRSGVVSSLQINRIAEQVRGLRDENEINISPERRAVPVWWLFSGSCIPFRYLDLFQTL